MNAMQSLPRSSSLLFVVLLGGCQAFFHEQTAGPTVKRVTVNGAELSYVEQGSGETVVFLHSLAADLRVWEHVQRRFPSDFRFVAYSRRHHTPNRWPDAGQSHTLDQHVDDLAALIPALGVDRAHVVALGVGARVAAHTAIRHAQRVQTLTVGDGLLVAPVTDDGRLALKTFGARFGAVAERVASRDERGTAAAVIDWLLSDSGGWDALPDARRAPYLDNARTLFHVLEDRSLRAPGCEALGKLRIPILVLAGERTPPGLKFTNAAVPTCVAQAEYREVPRSGHLWYADNPDDGVRLLVQFLTAHRRR
ncbi:MAG TPA: alpha/beta hydrolase [Casimicrobiaceae bacterium]|nr:alpha/beta hydrolase [Casimicrobiaceae bacterium]